MMTNTKTTLIETAKIKAIARHHAKSVVFLCPNGHVVASAETGSDFGGSRAAAEMSARTAGKSNVYDRLAQDCAVQDATERH